MRFAIFKVFFQISAANKYFMNFLTTERHFLLIVSHDTYPTVYSGLNLVSYSTTIRLYYYCKYCAKTKNNLNTIKAGPTWSFIVNLGFSQYALELRSCSLCPSRWHGVSYIYDYPNMHVTCWFCVCLS